MEHQIKIFEESKKFSKTAALTEEMLNTVLSDSSTKSEILDSPFPFKLPAFRPKNSEEAEHLLKSLFNNLLNICVTTEGSRFLLQLLPLVPIKKLFIVLNAIKESIKHVACDPKGSKLINYLFHNLPRRDKKWLFALLSKHYEDLVFDKIGSALLCDILFEDEHNFSSDLVKFVLSNLCILLKNKRAANVATAALNKMENLRVDDFFGEFISLNFKALTCSEVAFPFLIRLLELRRSAKISINIDLVNLVSKHLEDPNISLRIFFLASTFTDDEKKRLFNKKRRSGSCKFSTSNIIN